jgi:hypothetical protein
VGMFGLSATQTAPQRRGRLSYFGVCACCQHDNANTNENIVNSMVIGIKILCSNLFLDKMLLRVLNAKNIVIIHKIIVMVILEKSIIQISE